MQAATNRLVVELAFGLKAWADFNKDIHVLDDSGLRKMATCLLVFLAPIANAAGLRFWVPGIVLYSITFAAIIAHACWLLCCTHRHLDGDGDRHDDDRSSLPTDHGRRFFSICTRRKPAANAPEHSHAE
jgi:hypothetical protein